MEKTCKRCGAEPLYLNSPLCHKCWLLRDVENRMKREHCSRCYGPKTSLRTGYCHKCFSYVVNKKKFHKIPDKEEKELEKFIKQIIRREYKLYDVDLLTIVNWWATISLFPHQYWAKSQSEQIRLMWADLVEWSVDKNKIVKK